MPKSRAIPLRWTGDSNKQNGRERKSFGRGHCFNNLQEKEEEEKGEGSVGERGVFRQLLEELRLEDECNYRRYLRMDTETFQVRLNGFPYFVNTYSGCFGAFLNCERHFQIMVFMDIRNFSV